MSVTKKAMNWALTTAAILLAVIISQYVNASSGTEETMFTGGNTAAIYLAGNLPLILAYISIGLLGCCFLVNGIKERNPGYMALISLIALIPALLFDNYLPDGQSGWLMFIGAIGLLSTAVLAYIDRTPVANHLKLTSSGQRREDISA